MKATIRCAGTALYTLELDLYFEDLEHVLQVLESMTKNKVAYKVLVASGPGGGNPVLEVTGTKNAIVASLPNFFGSATDTSMDTFEFHAGLED